MYWVYLLKNSDDEWYIGTTSNLRRRLKEHKGGYGGQTTSRAANWKLIYCEGYLNQQDAFGREKFLKSGSGRRFIKKQLRYYLTNSH